MVFDDLVERLESVRRQVRSHPHFGDMEVNRSYSAISFDIALCEAVDYLKDLSFWLANREDSSTGPNPLKK